MNKSLLAEIRTRVERLDNAELNQLVYMVNDRRDKLTAQARGNLWRDKPVQFDNEGYRFFGRVTKVSRKNSKVKAIREDKINQNAVNLSVTEWTVPNGMLSHAPTFNVDQMRHTSVPIG